MVTVFGYGAPVSDMHATDLFKSAWGPSKARWLEQFEIVNILESEKLRSTWADFIVSHHYDVHPDFYDSWIFNHPRRTYEAFFNQYIDAFFIANNAAPRDLDLERLWSWYEALLRTEEGAGQNTQISS